MFQLDDKFLEDIGLNNLPEEQKKPFLQHIYDELELRVGTKLSDGMTDEQLEEFEAIIDRKDDVIVGWLEKFVPEYHNDVVFMQLQTSTDLDVNDPNLRADYAATKWLEINRSDYRQVVASVLEELKSEVIANRSVILGGAPA
jgi:protein-tyrosine-phosphatase